MPLNLTCKTTALRRAYQLAAPVVPTRSPKPILQYVLLRVGVDSAELLTADGEISMLATLNDPEMICEPGQVLINAKTLGGILSNIGSETLELTLAGDNLLVTSDRNEYKLATDNADEFPQFPATDGESINAPRAQVASAIHLTKFCCDTESTRYALAGVYFDFEAKVLNIVATDTRRLSCVTLGLSGATAKSCVIPIKAISVIEKLLNTSEGDCTFRVSDNAVEVTTGVGKVFAKLVEGRFPRYQDVIPKNREHDIQFTRDELASAVSQASIMTSEESRGVDFTFYSDRVVLTSRAPSAGESEIQIMKETGISELKTTFDPRYIAQYLAALEPGSDVVLRLIDGESAAVFVGGEGSRYVVMPLLRGV